MPASKRRLEIEVSTKPAVSTLRELVEAIRQFSRCARQVKARSDHELAGQDPSIGEKHGGACRSAAILVELPYDALFV